METKAITIDAADVRVLGYRTVKWEKDQSEHVICDIYSSTFGAAEVYLPQGKSTLTALRLAVLQDKGGRRRLTVRAV